jgi:transcription antitermination protein NusB
MISRRQIRIKVMQAIYAWYCTNDHPGDTFDINLKEFADEIRDFEGLKGENGDLRLLLELFYNTIECREDYDQLIQSKAQNWELERIALIDRILMQMGISEMTHFEEIPIKVTINEYLEIAKKFSTPKSSQFINGILDSLYIQFKETDKIQKSGRGLINQTLPKYIPSGRPSQRHGGQGGGQTQRLSAPPRKEHGDQPMQKSSPMRPRDETPKPPIPKNTRPENQVPSPINDLVDDKKKRPRIRKNDSDIE